MTGCADLSLACSSFEDYNLAVPSDPRSHPMRLELALSPTGHVHVLGGDPDTDEEPDAWVKKVVSAFSHGQASGLFALAVRPPEAPPPPSFSFWRDQACRYLTALCQTSENEGNSLEPVEFPPASETAAFLTGAPPMQGAEYLSAGVFQTLWHDLDGWVREEVNASGKGLAEFLKRRAPLWHQVGRVCFHLAENRRDRELPFAFMATYAPSLSRGGRVHHQPLNRALQEYAGARDRKAMVRLLAPVERAAGQSTLVRDLVDSGDIYHPLAWTPDDAHRFLRDVPVLEESGLLVRVPDWWHRRPRPRVAVTLGEKKQNRLGHDELLDFNVALALGDRRLTRDEWRRLMAGGDGLVQLRGQWVEVNRAQLAQALEHWKAVEKVASRGGISFNEGMRLLAGAPADLGSDGQDDGPDREWSLVTAGSWLGEMLAGLCDPGRLDEIQPGRMLRATLRPYQEKGIRWLWLLSKLGLGACLADDMGLGKTLQVLSLLLSLKKASGKKQRRPSLVVVPASLVANWKAEIARFAPTLEAAYLHPSEMEKDELAAAAADPGRAFRSTDVVLTTYGMVLRQAWLLDREWGLVVLDEAQTIKNPATRQTRMVKKLKSEARIALTGTPVENRLSDLWSLFDFLCPGLLGSSRRFKTFVKALEKRPQDRFAPLRNLVRPYILRRLKTDRSVIADLPLKTEVKAFCGLGKKQAVLYKKSVGELAALLDEASGMKRRGLVLAFLMRFKQICNHPSHFLGDGRYDPDQSGKFERLGEICEEIAARQEKVLVFTQFREMTEPIAGHLAGIFGREGLILHGGTPVKKRRRLIDAFQQEQGPPFFMLSLKAGGTGLNLTAASHVIHFDRWWNPAVENQATDRAFRIGQRRNVLVHKFVCRGTIEEKIDALIEEKTGLARDVVEGGTEKMLTEMESEELIQLVSLDIERACV